MMIEIGRLCSFSWNNIKCGVLILSHLKGVVV